MKAPAMTKCGLALLATLLLFPNIASAATDVWTVYAYGSGNVLRQIFEGMKGFVDDPGYRRLMYVLVLMMMVFVLVKGYIFNRPSPMPIVGIILAAFMLDVALYSNSARTDIHIEDQVHGEDYLVEDVPLVLAGASALTSEMSRYMVKLVEAFYMGPSIPADLMMSNNNTFNFTNKIIEGLQHIGLSEPTAKATFNSYVRECVVPEMYQGRIRLDRLMNSKPEDFWESIKVNNLARMSLCFQSCPDNDDADTVCDAKECPTPFVAGGITARDWRAGMMVPCQTGHTALGNRVTDLIGKTAFNKLGNTMLRDTTIMDGVISSSVAQITGLGGSSGTEHFVRAGMMNMFRESSATAIANGGGEGLIQVIGSEQAKAVQRTNWMVAAEVFAESVSYLWSALQAFIYAIFPIAIVLFFFPGVGIKAMGSYFGLLAWISLWMPFLAVINFLSLGWLAEDIRQLAMVPLSYASLVPISEAGANMQAITNFLGTMVPVLTYGMVKGGEFALTQIASDVSAPRASESAASNIASKSYSYGSIAANNFGANKFDGTTSYSMGTEAVSSKSGDGAVQLQNPMSGSTNSLFGAANSTTVTKGRSGESATTGGDQISAGDSVGVSTSNVGATSRMADMALSKLDQNSQQASNIRKDSQALNDSINATQSAGASVGNEVYNSASSKLGMSQEGALKTSGAAVYAAITYGMSKMSEGGVLTPENAGDAKDALKRANNGSFVEALKQSGVDTTGMVAGNAQSEKQAESKIDAAVAQGIAAQQAAGGKLDANGVANSVFAANLASSGVSKSDLEKLSGNGGMISPETASAIEQAKAEIGAQKPGAEDATDMMAAGARGLASFFSQLPIVRNAIDVNGAQQLSGKRDSGVEAGNRVSGGQKAEQGLSVGQAINFGQSLDSSLANTVTASSTLAASVKAATTNTNSVTANRGSEGNRSTSGARTDSMRETTAVSTTATMGNDDARMFLLGGDDMVAGVNGNTAVGAVQAAGQRANAAWDRADDKYRGLEAKTPENNRASPTDPSQPAVPTLGSNAGGIVDRGMEANGRNPGAVTANQSQLKTQAGVTGLEKNMDVPMTSFSQQSGGMIRNNGELFNALRGTNGSAETATAYGLSLSKQPGDGDGPGTAERTLTQGQRAAYENLRQMAGGDVVQAAADQQKMNSKVTPIANDAGAVYQYQDRGGKFSFIMAPGGTEGGTPVILSGGRQNLGAFLQDDRARVAGVNPDEYRRDEKGNALSEDQAVAKYDAKMAGNIATAEAKYRR